MSKKQRIRWCGDIRATQRNRPGLGDISVATNGLVANDNFRECG